MSGRAAIISRPPDARAAPVAVFTLIKRKVPGASAKYTADDARTWDEPNAGHPTGGARARGGGDRNAAIPLARARRGSGAPAASRRLRIRGGASRQRALARAARPVRVVSRAGARQRRRPVGPVAA